MNGYQPDMNSWTDFKGNWFKAEHIKVWPATVQVLNVKGEMDNDDNAQLIFDIVYLGKKYKFQPNKTNIGILEDLKVPGPKALEGKQIVFKQVMNFNPNTRKKVPSLEIESIK